MEDVKVCGRNMVFRLLCTLWGLLLVFILFTVSHKFVVVSGDSMSPFLLDGDIVLSSVCTSVTVGNVYMLREPEQGYYVVKRLIGVPGDEIVFKEGDVYRNGSLFMAGDHTTFDNITYNLKADEYLFVGDNRAESFDGRYWSRFIRLDEIEYQLDTVIYPFSHRRDVHWEGT